MRTIRLKLKMICGPNGYCNWRQINAAYKEESLQFLCAVIYMTLQHAQLRILGFYRYLRFKKLQRACRTKCVEQQLILQCMNLVSY